MRHSKTLEYKKLFTRNVKAILSGSNTRSVFSPRETALFYKRNLDILQKLTFTRPRDVKLDAIAYTYQFTKTPFTELMGAPDETLDSLGLAIGEYIRSGKLYLVDFDDLRLAQLKSLYRDSASESEAVNHLEEWRARIDDVITELGFSWTSVNPTSRGFHIYIVVDDNSRLYIGLGRLKVGGYDVTVEVTPAVVKSVSAPWRSMSLIYDDGMKAVNMLYEVWFDGRFKEARRGCIVKATDLGEALAKLGISEYVSLTEVKVSGNGDSVKGVSITLAYTTGGVKPLAGISPLKTRVRPWHNLLGLTRRLDLDKFLSELASSDAPLCAKRWASGVEAGSRFANLVLMLYVLSKLGYCIDGGDVARFCKVLDGRGWGWGRECIQKLKYVLSGRDSCYMFAYGKSLVVSLLHLIDCSPRCKYYMVCPLVKGRFNEFPDWLAERVRRALAFGPQTRNFIEKIGLRDVFGGVLQ